MTPSLAYRKHEAAILRGDVPDKYTRILPHIPGERILEIGSAEGVLACLLARAGKTVAALEQNADRHAAAQRLQETWESRFPCPSPTFINASIGNRLDLLDDIDTVVAVRVIYYFREDIDRIFAAIAARVPNVVLCGNRNRADAYHAGRPHEPLGQFNFYASAEGMRDILTCHGYEIVKEVLDGDAIIVGRRA